MTKKQRLIENLAIYWNACEELYIQTGLDAGSDTIINFCQENEIKLYEVIIIAYRIRTGEHEEYKQKAGIY